MKEDSNRAPRAAIESIEMELLEMRFLGLVGAGDRTGLVPVDTAHD